VKSNRRGTTDSSNSARTFRFAGWSALNSSRRCPSNRKTIYLVHIADLLSKHYQIGRGAAMEVGSVDSAVSF